VSFFWCTIHPFYTKESLGNQIPKLLIRNDKLEIRYSIDDNWNYQTVHDIGFNDRRRVKILHFTSPRYPAKLKILIDDVVVHAGINNNPIIFENVQCQVGFSGVKPANVTNLKYKPHSEYFGTGTIS